MKNPIFKTAVALLALSSFTTQIVAAPSSSKPQISMPQIKPLAFDTIAGKGGVIKITPILHASIQIEYRGKVILVDPISAGSYRKKADMILITHPHGDHLDKVAIAKVFKRGGSIVLPYLLDENVTSRLPQDAEFQSTKRFERSLRLLSPNVAGGFGYVTPGTTITTTIRGSVISAEAVAAYNIVRGPKPGQKFHPKGAFNGYVLTLGGKRIYIAGDTEATPEMKALKNIDAAFIPMNLPYTMTPQEAAIGVRAFRPKVVYPYHFRYPFDKPNTNPQQFIQALKGTDIKVRVLDWYNAAPVARFMAASKKG